MMSFNELQQVGSVKEKQDPRTEPCGTPKRTADSTELDVVGQTCGFLSLRFDVNQSMTFPPRLYDFLNRRRSVLWS